MSAQERSALSVRWRMRSTALVALSLLASPALAQVPPCMEALVCPAGSTVKEAKYPGLESAEQCTRDDGGVEGPGHGRLGQAAGFSCWELKSGQLTQRVFWPSGRLRREIGEG